MLVYCRNNAIGKCMACEASSMWRPGKRGFLDINSAVGASLFQELPDSDTADIRNGCECNLPDTISWLVDGTIARIRPSFWCSSSRTAVDAEHWYSFILSICGPPPSLPPIKSFKTKGGRIVRQARPERHPLCCCCCCWQRVDRFPFHRCPLPWHCCRRP